MPAIPDDHGFVIRLVVHASVNEAMIYSIIERAGFGIVQKNGIKFYPMRQGDGETTMQNCVVFFDGVRTQCSPENLMRNREIVRHLHEQKSNYADIPYTYRGRSCTYRIRLDRRLSGIDPFPLVTLGTDSKA